MQAVGWFSVLEFVWHCIFIDPLTFAFSFRYVLLSLVCLTSAIMRVHNPEAPAVPATELSEGIDPKQVVYTWEYIGLDDSAHGTQHGKLGSLLKDDRIIEVPDLAFKPDRLFYLRAVEPGRIVGYYHYKHETYEHISTPGQVQAVPAIEKPPAPPNRFIENELSEDKENQQRVRPTLVRKAKKKRQPVVPVTQKEFDEITRGTYPRRLGLNKAGQKLIHIVRAFRQKKHRGPWSYQGMVIGNKDPEDLTTDWMNENSMHFKWRKLTVLVHPGAWYRVAVNAVKGKIPDDGVAYISCTKTSVEKAFAYMGLTRQLAILSKSNFIKDPFTQVKQQIRRMGGFHNGKLSSSFRPLRDAIRKNLYFLQIRSKHVVTGVIDNTHAICIFDNLIFDVNVPDPLPLSRSNLDRCCVGGDEWIFDAVSRATMFTPVKGVATFISKHLRKPIA